MDTATRARPPAAAAPPGPLPERLRRILVATAGPALIVVSVLIALRGFALAPPLVPPGGRARRRPRAPVEPVRDGRHAVRGRHAVGLAVPADDGAVVAVRVRRGPASAHRAEPTARRPRAVVVPPQGGARARRGHGRGPVPRDGDRRLDHRDLAPVRRDARRD